MKNVGYRTYKQLYNAMVVLISDHFAAIWKIRKFEQSDKLQNRAIRFFIGLGTKTLSQFRCGFLPLATAT